MYKVFIVDDEIVVREGVRDNVNWEGTGFTLCGEAPDGEIALPMIQEMKPDILITDIKMPFMDGLQLSRIVKKSMPWVKIVILSGHDEFKFAKEAISIGVTEYLLKPVSASDLLRALDKLALQIENEKSDRENLELIKDQLKSNENLLKERFLNEFALGIVPPVEAIEKFQQYNINIIAKFYTVLVIEMEIREQGNPEYSQCLWSDSIISGILENNPDVIVFKRNPEETVIILKGESAALLEEASYSLAQSIKYEVERNTGCLLTIGIGGVRGRFQGIAASFSEADVSKSYKYVLGRGKIIGIKDIKAEEPGGSSLLKLDRSAVHEFLVYGSAANVDEFLTSHLKGFNTLGMKSLIYTYYIYMDIAITTARFIEELGGNFEEAIPELTRIEDGLANMSTVDQFREYARKILSKALEYRDGRGDRYRDVINKAKEYINNNFSDSDTSLNSIAGYVNMSPSHFSTIFSQETGETFIEYLTQTRIKKAMKLLKTTTQKSSEIAYKVGYNDPHYFSYIFKKVTGTTPMEFRNERKSDR